MILWSILPEELIFGTMNTTPSFEEIRCKNMNLLVERTGSDQYKINRILSTDPQDYLNPEIQPGSILNYKPVLERA